MAGVEKVEIRELPRCWTLRRVGEGIVYLELFGKVRSFLLEDFASEALRTMKAFLLGQIHALVMDRCVVYVGISILNGELDRRVNDRVSTPCTPASGGQDRIASGGQDRIASGGQDRIASGGQDGISLAEKYGISSEGQYGITSGGQI